MCGICGIAHTDRSRPVDVDGLNAMRDLLSHRGPDGAGSWCGDGIGLGHRRLSIIDLSGGAQPLANEDESVWVTFNGEIYNYRALTADLLARGHRFHTRSDTEVLVHGYEEYGLDLPSKLNGIFAFALYDKRRRRLIIVRDQLGVKPLFYGFRNGTLAFASEIKSVLYALNRPATISPQALQEYLVFRYVSHDRSFFEGVQRLPPGHMLIWEDGRSEVRRYWTLPSDSRRTLPTNQALDELDQLLGAGVERQMMSDVPLGAFCSGGVDSGLTTGYASRFSAGRLHTFSVGFDDPAWDESSLAMDTARRFNTEHHRLTARSSDVASLLSDLIWFNDEPLSHPNSVPLYQLSRMARDHVTVVLTGEGADEIFSGYPRHHIARFRHALERVPARGRAWAASLCSVVPGHRAHKLAASLPTSLEDSLLFNSAFVAPELVGRLTQSPVAGALERRRELLAAAAVVGDPIAWISRYETLTYLVSALDRMDRMSMAVGLEARVPFLDIVLAEWGLRLPAQLKASGRRSKIILKKLAERTLSERITRGQKSGFGLPLDQWFQQPDFAHLIDRLRDPAHPAAACFDRTILQSVVKQHRAGHKAHGELLWVLSNVFIWHEVQARSRVTQARTQAVPA